MYSEVGLGKNIIDNAYLCFGPNMMSSFGRILHGFEAP